MIKFRCGHCDQKLGVPDEWAGKRIRCNRCKESCAVPHPQIDLQPVSQPAPTSPSTDLSMPEGELDGGGFSSDFLDLATGQQIENRAELKETLRPPREKAALEPVRSGRGTGQDVGVRAGVLKGTPRILLAIGMGLAFTLIAGVLWTGIAAITRFQLFFLVVGVGWAAGFGMKLGLDRPGVLTGIVAGNNWPVWNGVGQSDASTISVFADCSY